MNSSQVTPNLSLQHFQNKSLYGSIFNTLSKSSIDKFPIELFWFMAGEAGRIG